MPPVDTNTTTAQALKAIIKPHTEYKISDFYKPISSKKLPGENIVRTLTAPRFNLPQSCDSPPGERGHSGTRPTAFSIKPPPPPPMPTRHILQAVEITVRKVDPEEDFLINPREFEVQSVSRITAPAGRVVYLILWRDGHTGEVPVSSIYDYISVDELERLENSYFKYNQNPETIYDDDPDYPGGAPSGGTLAYERGWLPGQKHTRPRSAPEQRRMRMQTRIGEGTSKRRGRPPKPRTPNNKPTGKPRGRPKIQTKLADVHIPWDGLSPVDQSDEGESLELPIDEVDGEEEAENREEVDAEYKAITYADELAAQLAIDSTSLPSKASPMITSGSSEPKLSDFFIPSSYPTDEDDDDMESVIFVSTKPSSRSVVSSEQKIPVSTDEHSLISKKVSLPLSPSKTRPLLPNYTSSAPMTAPRPKPQSMSAPKPTPKAKVGRPPKSANDRKPGRPPKAAYKDKPTSSRSQSSDDYVRMCDTSPPRKRSGFNPHDYEDFVTASEVDYIVEKILAFRRVQGIKLYLVKWAGYAEEQCTWEPLENLQGSKDMVEEFERSRLRGG